MAASTEKLTIPVAESAALQAANEIIEVLKSALEEVEKHIPMSADPDWLHCSCGNVVKRSYWTRHSTGADGSANAPRVLEILSTRN